MQGKVLSPAVMIIIQYGGPRSPGLGIMWLSSRDAGMDDPMLESLFRSVCKE